MTSTEPAEGWAHLDHVAQEESEQATKATLAQAMRSGLTPGDLMVSFEAMWYCAAGWVVRYLRKRPDKADDLLRALMDMHGMAGHQLDDEPRDAQVIVDIGLMEGTHERHDGRHG